MHVTIGNYFEDLGLWPSIDEAFAQYCEGLVENGPRAESGLGFGGHFSDMRSQALGVLGRYRLITGETRRAFELWAAGADAIDISEEMAKTCLLIAEHSPESIDHAIELAELLPDRNTKAQTLADLTEFV